LFTTISPGNSDAFHRAVHIGRAGVGVTISLMYRDEFDEDRGPEYSSAVADAAVALRAAGLDQPTQKELADTVWLARGLPGHKWPIAIREAADLIAHRRRAPPLPNPLSGPPGPR